MMGFIQSKAAQGDPEAIRTLETLRAMKLIKDEPKAAEEPKAWELLDMCAEGAKQRKRDYWMQRSSQ